MLHKINHNVQSITRRLARAPARPQWDSRATLPPGRTATESYGRTYANRGRPDPTECRPARFAVSESGVMSTRATPHLHRSHTAYSIRLFPWLGTSSNPPARRSRFRPSRTRWTLRQARVCVREGPRGACPPFWAVLGSEKRAAALSQTTCRDIHIHKGRLENPATGASL